VPSTTKTSTCRWLRAGLLANAGQHVVQLEAATYPGQHARELPTNRTLRERSHPPFSLLVDLIVRSLPDAPDDYEVFVGDEVDDAPMAVADYEAPELGKGPVEGLAGLRLSFEQLEPLEDLGLHGAVQFLDVGARRRDDLDPSHGDP